ncbi:MAG: hypothetical protein HZC36_01215 [Armatimonadetes bacterium]|nr:hypothetical protein [Armatimonadota bacterium]
MIARLALALLALSALLAGCGGGTVNEDELKQSQKDINASKEKGADSWQD